MKVIRASIPFLLMANTYLSHALVPPKALTDHSAAVVGLFNNMRTPAALIGGSLVPIGLLAAPQIVDGDSKLDRFMKKTYILVSVASLLSEILAVTYSSIAINKLVEVPQPATADVTELILQSHELAWIGTNVHFLLGLIGFSAIVGCKAYFGGFGSAVGRTVLGWSLAVFFQAVSIVNQGIAMGQGSGGDASTRFASNLFGLILRYIGLVVKGTKGGIFASAAAGAVLYSLFMTFKVLVQAATGSDNK
jgi:hypothetical protein